MDNQLAPLISSSLERELNIRTSYTSSYSQPCAPKFVATPNIIEWILEKSNSNNQRSVTFWVAFEIDSVVTAFLLSKILTGCYEIATNAVYINSYDQFFEIFNSNGNSEIVHVVLGFGVNIFLPEYIAKSNCSILIFDKMRPIHVKYFNESNQLYLNLTIVYEKERESALIDLSPSPSFDSSSIASQKRVMGQKSVIQEIQAGLGDQTDFPLAFEIVILLIQHNLFLPSAALLINVILIEALQLKQLSLANYCSFVEHLDTLLKSTFETTDHQKLAKLDLFLDHETLNLPFSFAVNFEKLLEISIIFFGRFPERIEKLRNEYKIKVKTKLRLNLETMKRCIYSSDEVNSEIYNQLKKHFISTPYGVLKMFKQRIIGTDFFLSALDVNCWLNMLLHSAGSEVDAYLSANSTTLTCANGVELQRKAQRTVERLSQIWNGRLTTTKYFAIADQVLSFNLSISSLVQQLLLNRQTSQFVGVPSIAELYTLEAQDFQINEYILALVAATSERIISSKGVADVPFLFLIAQDKQNVIMYSHQSLIDKSKSRIIGNLVKKFLVPILGDTDARQSSLNSCYLIVSVKYIDVLREKFAYFASQLKQSTEMLTAKY